MQRLYANFKTFYIRALGSSDFCIRRVRGRGPGISPLRILRKDSIHIHIYTCMCVRVGGYPDMLFPISPQGKYYLHLYPWRNWSPVTIKMLPKFIQLARGTPGTCIHFWLIWSPWSPPVARPTLEEENCSSLCRWVQHTSLLAREVWLSGFRVVCRPTGVSETSTFSQVQLVAAYLGCDGSFLDNEPAPPGTPFNLLEHVEKVACSAWYCYIK